MKIVEDTRNQTGKHKNIREYFEGRLMPIIRTKLLVGDYSRLDNMTVCIDTKKDYVELAGNICGKQHERFRKECIKAQENGIKLIVLVEEDRPPEQWFYPRKRNGKAVCNVSGVVLAKCMKTMHEKYGVVFDYCDKEYTGQKIFEILGGTEQ